MIYFEAQTGIVRDKLPEAYSNFHQYALPFRLQIEGRTVDTRSYLVDNINTASLGPGGLTYTASFLNVIEANDQTRKQSRRR